MNLENFVMNVLHPFIIYGLLGSGIMFLMVKAIIWFFGVTSSKARARLMFLPVVMPFMAYLVELIFRKCVFTTIHTGHIFDSFNNWICNISTQASRWLGPFISFFALGVVLKLIFSWHSCYRIVVKYGYAKADDYPDLFGILEDLAQKAGIQKPKIVVTEHTYAKSFTYGFRKPVVVISKAIIEKMEPTELEAVMAHEIAHIVRKDTPLNFISNLMRDLLVFAPPVLISYKNYTEEKEKAADDLALTYTGNPLALAGALIKVWRLTPKSFFAELSLHPSFIKKSGSLEVRIRRLMDGIADHGDKGNIYTLAFVTGLVVLLILAIVC